MSANDSEARDYTPEVVLVTGGAGFIGANFIRFLLDTYESTRVVNLDLLTYAGQLSNLHGLPESGRYHFVKGDICDRAVVDEVLSNHDVDTIVHFAAESHVDRSIAGPEAFLKTNIAGTFTLLESARSSWVNNTNGSNRPTHFHHISTDEVYGTLKQDDPPFTETTPYTPNSPYSASKASSDHLVRAYFHTYGLHVTTTNCSNNYGPFQHQEKFIPTIISSCLSGRPIPVYGNGSNRRDWLYVLDHCRAIDVVVRKGRLGETYNVGGENEWSNLDVVRLICHKLDERHPAGAPHESLISFVTDRPGHDWRYAIDTSKISSELRWRPMESFEAGIDRTLDWYLGQNKEHPSRPSI